MLSRGILARPRCFGKQQPKAPPLPPSPPLVGGVTSVVPELLPPYQLVALAKKKSKLVVVMLSRGILALPRCFGKQQPKAPLSPPGGVTLVPELLPPYQLVALAYDSVFSDVDGSLSVERCVTSSLIEGLRDEFDRPPLFVMDCWPLRNAAHSLDEEGLGFGLLLGRGTVLKKEKVAVEESNADVTNAAGDQQTSPGPISGGAGGIAASAVSPTNSVNESDDPQSPTTNSGLAQQALVETVSDDELSSSQKAIAVVAGGGDIAEEVMRVAPIRLAFSYLPHQGGLMAYYLLRALEGRSLFSRVVMSHAESSPKKIAAKARTQGWSVKHRPAVKIEDYEVSAVDLYAFISRRVESKGARFLFGDELASANVVDADDPPVASTPSVVPQGATAAGRKKKSIAPTPKPFVAGGGGASPQRSTSPAKTRAVSPPFLMRRPSKLASVTINRLVAQRETMRKDPFIAISDDSVVPALSFPPAIVTEMMRLSMTSSGNPFAEQKNIETMFHLDEARRFHVTMWTRCDVPQQLGGAPLHRTRSALEEAAVAAGGVGAAAATAPTLEEDTIYNNRWRRNLINMFQLAINGSRGVTRNGRMIQVVGTRCECSIILDFGAGWMDEPGTWKRIQTFLDNGIADAERITGKQKMFSVVKTLREGIVQIVCTHVDFRAVLLQTLASHERRAASKGLGFPRPNVWASIIVSILGTRRDFRRVRKMVALQSTGSHLLLLRNVESDPVAENFHAVVAKIQAVFRARKVRTFIRNVDDLIEREERVREMHESQFSAAMDEVAMLLRDAQEQELTTLEVASRDELTTTEVEEFVQLIDELKECLDVESLIGRREIDNVEEQEWMKLFEAPNRWMIQSAEEKRWAFMLHSHKLQFRQVWQRYYIIIEEYQERIRLRTDARAFVVKLPKLLRIPGFFSMQLPPCDFDVASSLVMFPPNFKTLYQKAKRAQEEPPQDF
ncbi:Hypothetical protein, putative [Bodo saltans]|uniref:Uncharacterized protein n=1 Tax=Bodo saltans TaxID=75058 RepID=A0A0S4J5Y1_BODSA|nr:Hypothetical protein, putative [Bodo saltans]|eukprot:CUG86859.1 Hypothetical protein, putative [Bodo saltans]